MFSLSPSLSLLLYTYIYHGYRKMVAASGSTFLFALSTFPCPAHPLPTLPPGDGPGPRAARVRTCPLQLPADSCSNCARRRQTASARPQSRWARMGWARPGEGLGEGNDFAGRPRAAGAGPRNRRARTGGARPVEKPCLGLWKKFTTDADRGAKETRGAADAGAGVGTPSDTAGAGGGAEETAAGTGSTGGAKGRGSRAAPRPLRRARISSRRPRPRPSQAMLEAEV